MFFWFIIAIVNLISIKYIIFIIVTDQNPSMDDNREKLTDEQKVFNFSDLNNHLDLNTSKVDYKKIKIAPLFLKDGNKK